MNYESAETPEAIRADIERTRAGMSAKINTIQERLSPQNLQEQAQEMVRDAINSSTDALTTYLRDNSRDFAIGVADTIRRNPIPAALIGLGAGWLLVETFGGSGVENERRSGSEYYGSGYYGSQPRSMDDRRSNSSGQYGSGREDLGAGYQAGSSLASSPPYSGYSTGNTELERQGVGTSAVEGVKETVGKAAEQVRDQAAQIGEQIGQVGEQVRNQSQQWIGETAEHLRSQTHEWTDRAGEQASHLSDQAYRQANMLGQQAQSQVDSAMRVAHRGYDANPVLFGAVALALGAAIGMALPSTNQEDEWMGEKRDDLVASAQGVVQEYGQRAQQAVEEVKPVLEQTANKVAEDLKNTGQQAMEDLKSSGTEAVETIKKRVQEPTDASTSATSSSTNTAANSLDTEQKAANKGEQHIVNEMTDVGISSEKAKLSNG